MRVYLRQRKKECFGCCFFCSLYLFFATVASVSVLKAAGLKKIFGKFSSGAYITSKENFRVQETDEENQSGKNLDFICYFYRRYHYHLNRHHHHHHRHRHIMWLRFFLLLSLDFIHTT